MNTARKEGEERRYDLWERKFVLEKEKMKREHLEIVEQRGEKGELK